MTKDDYTELRTQLTSGKWLIVLLPTHMNSKDWELLKQHVALWEEAHTYVDQTVGSANPTDDAAKR